MSSNATPGHTPHCQVYQIRTSGTDWLDCACKPLAAAMRSDKVLHMTERVVLQTLECGHYSMRQETQV